MSTSPARLVATVAAALLPATAAAQSATLQMPAGYAAPNFDRVFVGVQEAHEAGAYMSRTDGAAATWYNPAGIASVDRTVVSVNARGLELGVLSGSAPLQSSSQVSALSLLPQFVGFVLGPDVVAWRDVRIGVSATQQTAWSTLVWWGATDATGHWTYASDSSLASYLVAGSVGWAVSPRLRLGASLGVSWTRLYENDHLSALAYAPGGAEGTLRTRLLSGLVFDLVPSLAVQWDAAPWLAIGAIARAPGIRIWNRATIQGERQDTSGGTTRNVFLQDYDGSFEYRWPLELDGSIALRQRTWELELDVRYHAATGTYQLAGSSVPVETVTVPPGGAPVQSPFAPVQYQGRAVVDVAVGGNWAASRTLRLHAGLYACPSPVASTSPAFRQMDLYGMRAGISFRGEAFSGSVGIGYETGRAGASPDLVVLTAAGVDDSLRTQLLSIVFALEYRF